MELVLDISNELDIDVLCHKMLLNVGHLTKADRCSLFLARGPREKRYLEAKLFDVEATTSKFSQVYRSLRIGRLSQFAYLLKLYGLKFL